MVTHRSYPAGSAGCRWLIPAAEMAGLASGRWRPSPDPALARWPWLPRIATRALGADPGSVRAARDFTVTPCTGGAWQNAAQTSRSWYLSC